MARGRYGLLRRLFATFFGLCAVLLLFDATFAALLIFHAAPAGGSLPEWRTLLDGLLALGFALIFGGLAIAIWRSHRRH